jgi:hypothetical protein
MAVSEQDRFALHDRLAETLGPDAAGTLMSYLPPVGWADVATKSDLVVMKDDLRSLETGLRGEIAGLRIEFRAELVGLEGRMAVRMMSQMKTTLIVMTGILTGYTALIAAFISTLK